MWIFTRHGFFSIVAKTSDPETLKVRGRCRADLDALLAFVAREAPGLRADFSKIVETPLRDYGFRVFVPRASWAAVASILASDIDYTNFKREVHGDPARDRAYICVWSAMNRFQAEG